MLLLGLATSHLNDAREGAAAAAVALDGMVVQYTCLAYYTINVFYTDGRVETTPR